MPNPPSRGMALAIFILTSPVLAAEVVVLSAVADTSLFEFDPEYNFGRQRTLPAGSIGNMADANGARSRALYKFDVVGVIPPGSAIQSAVMAPPPSWSLPTRSPRSRHQSWCLWNLMTSRRSSASASGRES